MIATIYDLQTGWIVGVIDSPDLTTINLNAGEGQGIIEGAYDVATTYISPTGPAALPPKPGPWAQWDGAEWIDPRTPADLEAELQSRRDVAWLAKPDFLLACMEMGILTPADAAAAAQGIVPEPFQSAVDALDPMTQAYLAVIWPTATRIERMDPFILTIAAVRDFPDVLVDQLFGVTLS